MLPLVRVGAAMSENIVTSSNEVCNSVHHHKLALSLVSRQDCYIIVYHNASVTI